MLAEVALVVVLDLGEPVDVVHHQAGRARHALLGGVAHPVQALERGAVAEVKARHRIERLVALLRAAAGSSAHRRMQQRLQRLGHLAEVPGRVVELARSARARRSSRASPSQRAEAGDRRERGEAPQVRELALQLLGHLLDQQVAERDAAQAFLAVGDRVEHRAVGARRRRRPATRMSSSGCTCALMPRVSATSMKMIGSSGSCGWKKAKQRRSASRRRRRSRQPWIACTASYWISFSSTIAERAPVDALEAQEAAVEPRAQQVHAGRRRSPATAGARAGPCSSWLAHLDQRRGAAGRHVEAAEELLARRLDRRPAAASRFSGDGSAWYAGRGARHRLRGGRIVRAPARRRTRSRSARRAPGRRRAHRARARCSRIRRSRRAAPRTARRSSLRRGARRARPPPSSLRRKRAALTSTRPPPPSLRPPGARPRRRRRARGRPGT